MIFYYRFSSVRAVAGTNAMHPGSIPQLGIALGRQLSTNSMRDQCLNQAVDSNRTGAVVESGS